MRLITLQSLCMMLAFSALSHGCAESLPEPTDLVDVIDDDADDDDGDDDEPRIPHEPTYPVDPQFIDYFGTGEKTVQDRRVDVSYLPRDENSLFIELPEVLVPAGSETLTCIYGRYEGPDRGIIDSRFNSDVATNHHLIVQAISDDAPQEYPDGVPFNCGQVDHTLGKPMFHWFPGAIEQKIGAPLKSGQRFYMELHNLNVYPHDILVNAAFWYQLVPPQELTGYSAGWIFGPSDVRVETGLYRVSSTCVWPEDTNVLMIRAHMHETGDYFALDWTSDGQTTRILEVNQWEYEFVNENPPGNEYTIGELAVKKGDIFTTTCQWNNTTGNVIETPTEMCNSFGVAFPLSAQIECDGPQIIEAHTPP